MVNYKFTCDNLTNINFLRRVCLKSLTCPDFNLGAAQKDDRVMCVGSAHATNNKDHAHNQNYFYLLIFKPSRESWKINSINQFVPQIPATG